MSLALIAVIIASLGLIANILREVLTGGMKGGVTLGSVDTSIKRLQDDQNKESSARKDDVQDLHQSISVNNDMQNDRYREFYEEFRQLEENFHRLDRKVAKYTGDYNGGD